MGANKSFFTLGNMKYYLDTSAIYQLKKIPERILRDSFYSSFAILELVAGITVENFQKRKAILGMLKQSIAMRDNTFPEQLIFESFDSYNEYEYSEQRIGDLYGIADDILEAGDFEGFLGKQRSRLRKFDLEYFIGLDNFLTDNFYNSAFKGSSEIREALKESKGKAYVRIGDKKYDLGSRRAIVDFLNEPGVNNSFTIIALANAVINIPSVSYGKLKEKEVYESYNGKLNHFLSGMAAYSTDQVINDKNPRRNDFQDLLHLLYLRSSPVIKIISDDTLFTTCIPNQSVPLRDLTM